MPSVLLCVRIDLRNVELSFNTLCSEHCHFTTASELTTICFMQHSSDFSCSLGVFYAVNSVLYPSLQLWSCTAGCLVQSFYSNVWLSGFCFFIYIKIQTSILLRCFVFSWFLNFAQDPISRLEVPHSQNIQDECRSYSHVFPRIVLGQMPSHVSVVF